MELLLVELILVELVERVQVALEKGRRDGVLGALEHDGTVPLALALVDQEGDRRVIARGQRDLRRHLRVEEILFLIGETYPGGRLGQVGLAIEEAVLELGLLADSRLAEEIAALDDQRRRETHLATDVEDDLDAIGQRVLVDRNLLELLGRLERVHVAREQDRIVLGADLRLAPARNRTQVAAIPVQRLDLDIRNGDGKSRQGGRKRKAKDNLFHMCALFYQKSARLGGRMCLEWRAPSRAPPLPRISLQTSRSFTSRVPACTPSYRSTRMPIATA